jgi:hypothetical protein
MGVNNLFKAKKQLNEVAPPGERLAYINEDEANLLKSMGGLGTRENNPARIPSFIGASHGDHHGGGLSSSSSPGAADAGGTAAGDGDGFASQPYSGDPNDYANSYGPNGNPTGTPDGGEEEENTGFFQGVFDWFSSLAPTPDEMFANNWNALPSWEKQKMLNGLDFDPENMTAEALDAFDKASNMSWADIKELTSNISFGDLTSLPGSLGAAYSMFDALNPFTNTQYHLQDPNNWSQPNFNIHGNLGTYTGNIASLNSQQLNDLANMQAGGLNQTQLGQALAGQMSAQEEKEATRGNDTIMGTGTSDTVTGGYGDNGVTIEDSNEYKDLIARGFSDAYARNVITSGNYFASYD